MVVEIAGQQWDIKTVAAHHPGLCVDGTFRSGACWCAKYTIYLSNELAGDQVARTTMHELVHAFIYSTQALTVESWREEDICEFFAIYGEELVAVLRVVCKRLFPATVLRKWDTKTQEARV